MKNDRSKRGVTLAEVANRLPLYIYFDKSEFSKLTKVSLIASNLRLKTLVKDGFLERKDEAGKAYWFMSCEAKQKMLTTGKANHAKRGRKPENGKSMYYFITDIIAAERQAHYQNAYMILKSIKFV